MQFNVLPYLNLLLQVINILVIYNFLKKNYKLPEYLLPEELNLDTAKHLIAYKQKISEQWLEKKNSNSKDESDDESSESSIVKKLTKSV